MSERTDRDEAELKAKVESAKLHASRSRVDCGQEPCSSPGPYRLCTRHANVKIHDLQQAFADGLENRRLALLPDTEREVHFEELRAKLSNEAARLNWLERKAKVVMLGDTPGYYLAFSWDAVDDLASSIDAAMDAEQPK